MSDMDKMAYVESQLKSHEEYESLCKQCGRCCGLETDPCANLKRSASGKYHCAAYGSRLGRQVTVSGRIFTCVEIREVVRMGRPNEECGYGR